MPVTDTPIAAPTIRLLRPEEYARLRALPFGSTGHLPDPAYSLVLVAEDPSGEIVGLWAALTYVHLDGLWVAPEYRQRTSLAGRLLAAMKQVLRDHGITQVFTLVRDLVVLNLAVKAGFEMLPHTLCLLNLPAEARATSGEEPCL